MTAALVSIAAIVVAALGPVSPARSQTTLAPAPGPDPARAAGSFESHADGFIGVRGTRVTLSRQGAGRHHSRALVLRNDRRRPAVAVSERRPAGARAAGTAYTVRLWVRGTTGHKVGLRVRELVGGRKVRVRSDHVVARSGAWRRLDVRLRTKRAGSTLELRVRAARPGTRLRVDDLRISPGGAAARDGVAGTLTNGCGRTARGIPLCGTYVGAAHGSNTDPSALEQQLGDRLAIRRTYFTATGVDSAVRTAQTDLATGRLPWISFKAPYSWTDMANGRGDAWVSDLARRLAALGGPVWVAFHHEPEGDGDIQEWRRMQEHLAPLVRGLAPNVAFTVVMTGWHQFYGDAQYSLAQIWPRGVEIDVAGFDIYQQYGVVKNGATTTKWTDFAQYYQRIASWAAGANVAWALGETGVTDTAAAARPSEITDAVTLMEQYGGVAYSYFDSSLNSVAPWTLGTAVKRDAFARALVRSPSLS